MNDSLRVSYRVKLSGIVMRGTLRTQYVDVRAMNPDEAARLALTTHSLATSAQCVGRTADLEREVFNIVHRGGLSTP